METPVGGSLPWDFLSSPQREYPKMSKKLAKTAEAPAAPATTNLAGTTQPEKNLYVRVDTFNTKGEQIGTRIVDMYHFGTRNWLQSHTWWAMHNSHTVKQDCATDAEVEAYVAEQAKALAERFNGAAPTAANIAA